MNTVGPPSDRTVTAARSGRKWATHDEIIALAQVDAARRGKRYHSNVGNHWCDVSDPLRALAARGLDTVTVPQLVRELYDDDKAREDTKCRERSVRNWLRGLERMGVIETEVLVDEIGMSRGLRFRWLPVQDALEAAKLPCMPVRGYSSVGRATAVRRRETACERKARSVRPHRRRTGNLGVGRYLPAPPPFSPANLCRPGASPSFFEGGEAREGGCVRARGPGQETAADAIERTSTAEASATPGRPANGSGGREAPAWWQALEARCIVAAAAAGGPLVEGLGHLPTIERLAWVLARLDRYADRGAGREGAGAQLLLERLADAIADGRRPRHVAYLLPELEQTARRWKHTWAPRLKDARRPGRTRSVRRWRAAIGYDPRKGPKR